MRKTPTDRLNEAGGSIKIKAMGAPKCRRRFRNPHPTVDVIIEVGGRGGPKKIVLIKRKNPPPGWALPGGFVDYGESLEEAAVREAREETSLRIELRYQLHTYSDPRRDPRIHTITTVYVARAKGKPSPRDDAAEARLVDPRKVDLPLAFDHGQIIRDYVAAEKGKRR